MGDKGGGRSQHQSCQIVGGRQVWQMTRRTISLQAFNFPTAEREKPGLCIQQPPWKAHLCPLFMVAVAVRDSTVVSQPFLLGCMKSLWYMPCTACCTRLLVEAPNKCNVAFILKLWILLVLQHNIFSLLKQRKALEDGEIGVMWILWCIWMQIHFLFMETNVCRNM